MVDVISVPDAQSSAGIPGGEDRTRKLAAIDIGTNSTHLLIAAVDSTLGTFSIELAEKSTTRLGERDPETGALTDAAMQRGWIPCVASAILR